MRRVQVPALVVALQQGVAHQLGVPPPHPVHLLGPVVRRDDVGGSVRQAHARTRRDQLHDVPGVVADRVVEPLDLNVVDVATVHPSLTREACLESMHLVRRDGRVVAGFDAVATLARWLPPGWPLGALALVPGVAPVGRRIYHAIAASRPRDVPCTDEVCAPRPPASAAPTGRRRR